MGNNLLYWQKLGRVFVSFGKITEKSLSAIAHLSHLTPNQSRFSAKIGKNIFPPKLSSAKTKFLHKH
ncbi:hypothetical protein [Nostoc sp. PCC 7107]|uniref:hypothetical protein n=1 Tax=Nostoc sp. PCC 7107 TaxID=317936 RepID=UPI00030AE4B0|nr:hypothetical protein [Nostoc sp. PCC 7107]